MSNKDHIPLSGPVRPKSDLDNYNTHYSDFGDYDKSVDTLLQRNSIPEKRRKFGMQVTINSDGGNNGLYLLRKGFSDNDPNNNANWQKIFDSNWQISPGLVVEEELRNVVFCEQFTGNGSQTQFQLDGTVTNASFTTGSWDVSLIQSSLPSYANKPNGGKIYETVILGIGSGEVKVSTISPSGLVTLDRPPRSENFIICYWYKILPSDDLGDSYTRLDITTTMEADAINTSAKIDDLQDQIDAIVPGGGVSRDRYVIVKQKSDFPTPIGGIITLLPDYLYEINGSISLGTDRIELDDNTVVVGRNGFDDELVYTGTGDMFTAVDCSNQISNLTISCLLGRIFNVSTTLGNEKTKEFLLNRCKVTLCSKIGVTQSLKNVSVVGCLFETITSEGILSVGSNNGDFAFFDCSVKTILGTLFNLSTSVWDLWQSDRNEINIPLGSVGVTGLANNGNINIKGLVTSNNWLGDGEFIDATPANDIRIGGTKWDFLGNSNVPDITDNIATGFLSFEANAVVTNIITQNIWEKIAGVTIIGSNNIRFDTPVDNRLRYLGENEYKGNVTITGNAAVASGSNNYGFTVFKNGVKLPNVNIDANVVNGKPNGFAFSAPIEALTNDYFEVYVRCLDSNKDITVTNLQASIG